MGEAPPKQPASTQSKGMSTVKHVPVAGWPITPIRLEANQLDVLCFTNEAAITPGCVLVMASAQGHWCFAQVKRLRLQESHEQQAQKPSAYLLETRVLKGLPTLQLSKATVLPAEQVLEELFSLTPLKASLWQRLTVDSSQMNGLSQLIAPTEESLAEGVAAVTESWSQRYHTLLLDTHGWYNLEGTEHQEASAASGSYKELLVGKALALSPERLGWPAYVAWVLQTCPAALKQEGEAFLYQSLAEATNELKHERLTNSSTDYAGVALKQFDLGQRLARTQVDLSVTLRFYLEQRAKSLLFTADSSKQLQATTLLGEQPGLTLLNLSALEATDWPWFLQGLVQELSHYPHPARDLAVAVIHPASAYALPLKPFIQGAENLGFKLLWGSTHPVLSETPYAPVPLGETFARETFTGQPYNRRANDRNRRVNTSLSLFEVPWASTIHLKPNGVLHLQGAITSGLSLECPANDLWRPLVSTVAPAAVIKHSANPVPTVCCDPMVEEPLLFPAPLNALQPEAVSKESSTEPIFTPEPFTPEPDFELPWSADANALNSTPQAPVPPATEALAADQTLNSYNINHLDAETSKEPFSAPLPASLVTSPSVYSSYQIVEDNPEKSTESPSTVVNELHPCLPQGFLDHETSTLQQHWESRPLEPGSATFPEAVLPTDSKELALQEPSLAEQEQTELEQHLEATSSWNDPSSWLVPPVKETGGLSPTSLLATTPSVGGAAAPSNDRAAAPPTDVDVTPLSYSPELSQVPEPFGAWQPVTKEILPVVPVTEAWEPTWEEEPESLWELPEALLGANDAGDVLEPGVLEGEVLGAWPVEEAGESEVDACFVEPVVTGLALDVEPYREVLPVEADGELEVLEDFETDVEAEQSATLSRLFGDGGLSELVSVPVGEDPYGVGLARGGIPGRDGVAVLDELVMPIEEPLREWGVLEPGDAFEADVPLNLEEEQWLERGLPEVATVEFKPSEDEVVDGFTEEATWPLEAELLEGGSTEDNVLDTSVADVKEALAAVANEPQEQLEVEETPLVFEEGEVVVHEKYGRGVVQKVMALESRLILNIQFESVGKRLLDPSLSGLGKG